jgi:hypothetical protein
MYKSNNYWNTLQSISEWIRFSDMKAGIIITAYSVILTIICTNVRTIYEVIFVSPILTILTIIACIVSLASLFSCFLSINPQLTNKNSTSVLYYGHIAQLKNYEEYLSLVSRKMENEFEFEKQITEQIYANSKIAWKKFQNVTWSIRFFFVSIFILFIEIIIYLFV